MHQIKTERYKGFLPLKVALVLVAVIALVTLVFWQMKIADKKDELSSIQAQILVQNTRNSEIRKAVGSLESEEGMRAYAEKEARKDLDFAKPGERIFVDVGGSD